MKELLIFTTFALFVSTEARPGVVTQNPVELEKSITGEENNVRVRRQSFDYGDYMAKFWQNWGSCPDCKAVNIGNGYKNRNTVHFEMGNKSPNKNHDMINIGNGRKNVNTVFFSADKSYDVANIGNGSKNTNTVFFGVDPASINGDPFKGSFWDN